MLYRGRYAPSPTGDLHLGSAAAALFAAAAARARAGTLILRIEDLDQGRVIPGAAERIVDDLTWLGVTWDEGPDRGGPTGPYVQSARTTHYEAALARLEARNLIYLCDCSRAEIARAASAPHAGEEGPRYPGTCRPHGMRQRAFRRPPAVRLAVPQGDDAHVVVDDAVLGRIEERVDQTTGDFVLRRGDGVYSYQLAVVVDDLAMGVTEIVRGGDLATSAPRQALLARLLGAAPPRFAHIPLLLGQNSERLAKRARGVPIRDQRQSGGDGRDLARAIARAYAHDIGDAPDPIEALAARLSFPALRGLTVMVDERLSGSA